MTKDEWYKQLFERLDNSKFRRRSSHKNHMKGPRKRTEEDDVRFAQSFEKLILMAKSKEPPAPCLQPPRQPHRNHP